MENAYTEQLRGYTVNLIVDQDPISPRENDNAGTIVGWHRNYNLGDEQPSQDPQEWREQYEVENPKALIIPVYMYDHSGISLSTGAFSCPWDSGQVGYIVISHEKMMQEWGNPGDDEQRIQAMHDKATECLTAEVEEYSSYLNGDVYGYTITDANGDEVHACWGFIGFDYAKAEALNNVPTEPSVQTTATITLTYRVNVKDAREWSEEHDDNQQADMSDEDICSHYLQCQVQSNSQYDGVAVEYVEE